MNDSSNTPPRKRKFTVTWEVELVSTHDHQPTAVEYEHMLMHLVRVGMSDGFESGLPMVGMTLTCKEDKNLSVVA